MQGIISELESQGALPRSNSRVSSLATCCGPRLVVFLCDGSCHVLLIRVCVQLTVLIPGSKGILRGKSECSLRVCLFGKLVCKLAQAMG